MDAPSTPAFSYTFAHNAAPRVERAKAAPLFGFPHLDEPKKNARHRRSCGEDAVATSPLPPLKVPRASRHAAITTPDVAHAI